MPEPIASAGTAVGLRLFLPLLDKGKSKLSEEVFGPQWQRAVSALVEGAIADAADEMFSGSPSSRTNPVAIEQFKAALYRFFTEMPVVDELDLDCDIAEQASQIAAQLYRLGADGRFIEEETEHQYTLQNFVELFLQCMAGRIRSEAEKPNSVLFPKETLDRLDTIIAHLAVIRKALQQTGDLGPRLGQGRVLNPHDRSRNRVVERGGALHTHDLIRFYAYEQIQRFLTASPWLDQVDESLRVLRRAARHLTPQLRSELGSISTSDHSVTAVQALLRNSGVLRRAFSELDELDTPEPGEQTGQLDARQAREAARWLTQQSVDPEFRLCEAITGTWGSGKSRLVAQALAETIDGSRDIVLFPRLDEDALEESILRDFLFLVGSPVATLREAGRLVSEMGLGGQLVIVIEDLDVLARTEGILASRLASLMEATSGQRNIRWIVTANFLRLDAALPLGTDRAFFWRHFGIRHDRPEQQLAGWLDLDSANRTEHIGTRLIQQLLRGHAVADQVRALTGVAPVSAMAALENPQIALLRAQQVLASAQPSTALTANTEFVAERLVADKVQHIAASSASLESAAIDRAIEVIARHVTADAQIFSLSKAHSWLRKEDPSTFHRRHDRIAVLRTLRGGLLRLHRNGDQFGAEAREHFTLTLPVVWGHRIAWRLRRQLVTLPVDTPHFEIVKRWTQRSVEPDLRQSIGEFVLSLQEWAPDPAATRTLWRDWLSSKASPAPPLLTAANSRPEAAGVVWESLQTRGIGTDTPSRQELFALIIFTSASASEPVGLIKRLRILQPHYEACGQAGLSSLLLYAINRVMVSTTPTDRDTVRLLLDALTGIERAALGSEVSEIVVAAAFRACDRSWPAVIEVVGKYLRDRFERRVSTDGTMPVAGDPFWVHLCSRVAHQAVQMLPVRTAFEYFRDADWIYNTQKQMRSPVPFNAQTAVTFAVTARLHRAGLQTAVGAEFMALLDDFIAGRAVPGVNITKQRVTAFYLIRHSRPRPPSGAEVRVSEDLRPRLQDLVMDAEVCKQIRQDLLERLCKANDLQHR